MDVMEIHAFPGMELGTEKERKNERGEAKKESPADLTEQRQGPRPGLPAFLKADGAGIPQALQPSLQPLPQFLSYR